MRKKRANIKNYGIKDKTKLTRWNLTKLIANLDMQMKLNGKNRSRNYDT